LCRFLFIYQAFNDTMIRMLESYFVTVGLEVHAELHTNSKMWCGCRNDPWSPTPNANVCEVCMAHPGTLPVPNKEAIKKVIQVGLAVNADIANFTEFDRKNYFYPDIPKGYQLSQYKLPIVSNGSINNWPLTRIHLEEDTAKSSHDNNPSTDSVSSSYTLVDYNRAGVPLMELVTEPFVFESSEEAAEASGNFGRELQRILRYLGASEANMEMGQMRVEANISVSKDRNVFGTKCEVKNLNSFRSVEEAIKYEVLRHIEIIEEGGKVIQETRGWNETKLETFSQRKKENAHDYRYFPDPDLPKLYLTELFDIQALKSTLPEMPSVRKSRLLSLGLKEETAGIIVDTPNLAFYFDKVTEGKGGDFILLASNYIVGDIIGLLKKENKEPTEGSLLTVNQMITLIEMIVAGELSSRAAKDLLPLLLADKTLNTRALAEEKGLIQKNDPEALKKTVEEVLTESPTQVADYKSGKEQMFMYFVGQCMKKSKGAGNPSLFQELLKEALGATTQV
jgi:aspartyl-tRNA(Asn)/glutamyl-tRNA(Gln) amidotransferase subunit B